MGVEKVEPPKLVLPFDFAQEGTALGGSKLNRAYLLTCSKEISAKENTRCVGGPPPGGGWQPHHAGKLIAGNDQ